MTGTDRPQPTALPRRLPARVVVGDTKGPDAAKDETRPLLPPGVTRRARLIEGDGGTALIWRSRRFLRAAYGPTLAAALVVIVAAVVVFALQRPVIVAPPRAPTAEAPSPEAAPVAPTPAEPDLAASLEAMGRRVAPAEGTVRLEIPPEARRTITLDAPFLALTSSQFQTVGNDAFTVRLADIEGFRRDQVCREIASELRFACGLQGRAALTNIIAGRRLTCAVARDNGPRDVDAVCNIDAGLSVNGRLVLEGWAIPRPDKREAYGDIVARRCETGRDRAREQRICEGR